MSAPVFTCLACQVGFSTADEQRIHYRTDWHRYNLKRRIAEAAPVGEEEFRGRVDAQQQRTRDEAGRATFSRECRACNKTYVSENGYNAHLLSKRHKELEASLGASTEAISTEPSSPEPEAMEVEESQAAGQRNWKSELASAETDEQLAELIAEKRALAPRLPPTACIFCPHTSESVEDNLGHMSSAHSFFVPYLDNMKDLEGLLRALSDVVTVENLCLYCGDTGRRMHTMEAVRKHMADKGHSKIGEEVEEHCEEFYDFGDEESGKGTALDLFNGRTDGTHISADQHLHLPNGGVAIPRSLAPYYKQNMVPYHKNLSNVTKAYKMLGYHEEPLDVREKRRAQRIETRGRNKHEMGLGQRGNGLQHYFRVQIPF